MIDNLIGVKGKRICFLGNISHKKSPLLLIQAFNAIHKYDSDFTLHLAGRIDESRQACMLDYLVPKLELQDAIAYHGFVTDVDDWLSNFDYIINTSPLEGHCVSMLQGMACGLTPLFFASVGIYEQYPPSFIWKDFSELIDLIKKGPQDPEIIKKFVKEHYSLEKQLNSINEVVEELLNAPPKVVKEAKKSTVSAIIAVKNGEKTIERALNSLLKQTLPLKKIVVVDDGSTDNTVSLVNSYVSKTTIPLEVVSITPSRWVFSARNLGVKDLDSDYFFFLDADDLVELTYAEEMTKILDANPVLDIIYPDMVYFNEFEQKNVFAVPEFSAQILAERNFIAYSAMQRTARFKKLGGYSNYLNDCRNHLTEWEFWLRCLKNGFHFQRLAKPLFHYFKAGNSLQMSGNYERQRCDMHLQMAVEITGGTNIMMEPGKQRILLVCQGRDYMDASRVGFELFTWAKPLEMNGKCEVYTFFYDVETNYRNKAEMETRLKALIELIKPAYIFHPIYRDGISVYTWQEISTNWNTICFHSDQWRYLGFCKEYEKGFRYTVTTYPSVYEQMEHPGRILSQWAANTFYFKPLTNTEIDVSFCGQVYSDRKEMVKGRNVDCYGIGWKNGFIDFPEMAKVLGRSKISISFSKGADGVRQLKLRPFEITASGALCLCETMPNIEQFFEVGKEIVLFEDRKELEEKIAYYLSHEDERSAIAAAGYRRTLNDHTWELRFEEIFKKINEIEM